MVVQLVTNGIIAGSTYALIAIGFVVIYRTVRFFHFAHGAVFVFSAYVAWSCTKYLAIHLPLAGIVGALAGGLLGVAMNVLVYRSLRRQGSPSLILLLASFGMFVLIQSFLQLIFGADIKHLAVGSVTEGFRIGSAAITGKQIVIVVSSVVIAGAVVLLIRNTLLGKAIRAVADDPIAASLVGIQSERVISYAFFVGSMLSGASGVLIGWETDLQPTMGLNAAIKGIIAALIGGVGSIPGAMVGGLLIGLAENVGVWGIPAGWKDAISFGLLVVFLLCRPNGIFNSDRAVRIV